MDPILKYVLTALALTLAILAGFAVLAWLAADTYTLYG